jgi:hypothetical protein
MDDRIASDASGSEASSESAGAKLIVGRLVTETLDYGGGRPVTVYVPPDPPEALVFSGDGQAISQWGAVLETADVPPTMFVGVHGLADEAQRLHEYSPVFDATRWADALRAAGADVVMIERVASHGSALWQAEFPLMVAWAFGR